MTKPFVGLPATNGGCQYSRDLDQPQCGNPAVVHVIGQSPWGRVGLPTCAAHMVIAVMALRELIELHPAQGCQRCGNREARQ